jgi:hypothetical protein
MVPAICDNGLDTVFTVQSFACGLHAAHDGFIINQPAVALSRGKQPFAAASLWTGGEAKSFGPESLGIDWRAERNYLVGMTGDSTVAGLRKLFTAGGLPELGPGPRQGVLPPDQLEESLKTLLSKAELSRTNSDLVRALVLLWHDRLDGAHAIAQGIENADGSFVHGIVHRREPEYSNARYWFRLVGSHGAFPQIADEVSRLLESSRSSGLAKELIPKNQWDPFVFIDLCANAAGKSPTDAQVKLLREIQGIESEALLEHLLAGGA